MEKRQEVLKERERAKCPLYKEKALLLDGGWQKGIARKVQTISQSPPQVPTESAQLPIEPTQLPTEYANLPNESANKELMHESTLKKKKVTELTALLQSKTRHV